jgi:hypothetical protein
VHLLGFTVEIYHDARPYKRQNLGPSVFTARYELKSSRIIHVTNSISTIKLPNNLMAQPIKKLYEDWLCFCAHHISEWVLRRDHVTLHRTEYCVYCSEVAGYRESLCRCGTVALWHVARLRYGY